jgi:triosephosphate isomerase
MASKIPRGLIGGNWKCNGTIQQLAERVKWLNAGASAFPASSEVVIAAPAIHLLECKRQFHPSIAVASQDVGFKKGFGAFTGEMSAEMLVDAGIKWTLTGHSERRVGFGFPVSLPFGCLICNYYL